jgi:hypothetical protein
MMEWTPYINWRSIGFFIKEEFIMTVLRGHAHFSIKVKIAQVKDTRLGEEILQ